MKSINFVNKLSLHGKHAANALVVLAIVTLFLPQTALAASSTCQAYYTVRSGDSTAYISQTFGFKWVDIATANDLKNYQKPAVGQVLCIPPADQSTRATATNSATTTSTSSGVNATLPEDDPYAVFNVNISGGRIYVTLSDFSVDHVYLVKTRNVNTGIGGWYELGDVEITEDSTQSFSWSVPKDLRGTTVLNVCFKDQTTNELICRSAVNSCPVGLDNPGQTRSPHVIAEVGFVL